ncbi:MAG TPA: methyltransferase domain-containing protein [Ktedonobacterales bacterium]|nr:methyltransferase domain-containing protein [Ktedonobacterales bacterium]
MEPGRSHDDEKTRGGGPSAETLRTHLVRDLRAGGILRDAAVERALLAVPRHLFLPDVPLREAYADIAVPTRWQDGAPISSASQPAIVAIMLEQLRVTTGMRVLEIGAGTGYNAALLAELVGPSGVVTTLDIDRDIVDDATTHLAAAGYTGVHAITSDGAFGWPENAPYDRVILTVGAADIAPAWFDQLAEGGLLVLPLWLGGAQASVAFRKRGGALRSESIASCGFMRLRGEEAGSERVVTLPGGRQLFAEDAERIADPIAALLRTRPRLRFWTRPTPPILQRLGVTGHLVVSLYNQKQGAQRQRTRARQGVYVEGEDGPSLALFSNSQRFVLYFGSDAAERAVKDVSDEEPGVTTTPIERWRIVAYPIARTPPAVPAGALRLTRRRFAYDIWLDDGAART